MFSFFRSKKHSPDSDSSTSESANLPIPSAGSDEYVMIDKKDDGNPGNKLYPDFDVAYPFNFPPAEPKSSRNQPQDQRIHHLQGVPFLLSKELLLFETMETYVVQMTEAISFMTAKLSLDGLDYDFKLEKSILETE